MKLREVLKHIGFDQKVQILIDNSPKAHEVVFEGDAMDVPWVWAEYELDTDINGEAMFAFIPDDKNEAWLGIYVREE